MADITAKVKGVPVVFSTGTLIVPPLSLGSVEVLQDRLTTYTGQGLGQVGIVIDSLHHALKRNYPDMTREDVGDLVDMENMQAVMEAVMNVAGLREKASSKSGGAKAVK